MKECANKHPLVTFKEELESCPICVVWSEYGKLSIQKGILEKKIEKRKKIDDVIKVIYSCLED